jgi:hypothetical protein
MKEHIQKEIHKYQLTFVIYTMGDNKKLICKVVPAHTVKAYSREEEG